MLTLRNPNLRYAALALIMLAAASLACVSPPTSFPCGTSADWIATGGEITGAFTSSTDVSSSNWSYDAGSDTWTREQVDCVPGDPDYECVGATSTWEYLGEGVCVPGDTEARDAPPPTAIWLAAVCEPLEGFSSDGWMTVGSDASSKPYGTALYVAASPEGPWSPTEFASPPYVLSQAHVDALTALVGLTDYHDLWLRAGTNGTAANLGSMIIDRDWRMDELCDG